MRCDAIRVTARVGPTPSKRTTSVCLVNRIDLLPSHWIKRPRAVQSSPIEDCLHCALHTHAHALNLCSVVMCSALHCTRAFQLRAVETMHKSLISSRKPEISLQTLDHVVSANEEIATRITLMDTSLDKCNSNNNNNNNNNGSSNTPSHAKVEAPKQPTAAVPAIRGGRRESLHLRSILLSVVITNFLFIALFLPFYVFSLLLVAQGDRPSKLVMDLQRHAGALLFLYHAINPLAYVLSYRSLKRHFLEVLCCRSSKFNDASQVVMRARR